MGYSSDFNFQMNMGGALGDLNWLDEGDVPTVSFQGPHDQFAPYTTGVLIVPTTNEPVVEVSGAYDIHSEINGYATNNNAVFAEIGCRTRLSLSATKAGTVSTPFSTTTWTAPTEPFDGAPGSGGTWRRPNLSTASTARTSPPPAHAEPDDGSGRGRLLD